MRFLGFAFLVVGVSALAAEPAASVPTQFQGHWASSLGKCNTTHEGSLDIAKDGLKFFEGRGRVLSVRSISASEVEFDLESTSEGETSRNSRRFVLSSDGAELTDVTDKNAEHHFTRMRCKKVS